MHDSSWTGKQFIFGKHNILDGFDSERYYFRFYKEIKDLFYLLNNNYTRYFEVESNTVDFSCRYGKTSDIKIIREIYHEEMARYVDENIFELINDDDSDASAYVAKFTKRNKVLEKLSDHPLWWTRLEVAKRGFCLDKLVKENHAEIRWEIAKRGWLLDTLIFDDISIVREKAIEMILKKDFI